MPTLVQESERLVAVEAPRGRASSARVAAAMADQRHLHVLGHRHGQEGLRDLEGAPDPAPEPLARRERGDVLAVERTCRDPAGAGRRPC